MATTNGIHPGQPQSPPRRKVNLRPATLNDAAEIARVGALSFSVTFGHSVPAHELQAFLDQACTPAAVSKDISNPDKDMIVAMAQNPDAATQTSEPDTIVGFALLTRNTTDPCITHFPQTVELQKIYVHPDCQGLGIGTLLAAEVDSMARKQGYKNMWLGVWEENVKARRVYERIGFRRVGEHDFLVGSVVQTDWIMIKTL